jgi:hypothetical protein
MERNISTKIKIMHYQYLFLYNQSYQTQLAEERTSCTYSNNNNLQTKGTREIQELQVHMCTRTRDKDTQNIFLY